MAIQSLIFPPPPLPFHWETWKTENLPTETPQGRPKIQASLLGLARAAPSPPPPASPWRLQAQTQRGILDLQTARARARALPLAPYPAARAA